MRVLPISDTVKSLEGRLRCEGLEAGAPCPEIDADLCIGCGLCVDSCAFGALSMRQVRPPEFIPA